MKEKILKAIPYLALAFFIASIVTNYLGLDFYGILTAVAVPLCIIGVYQSLRQKKNEKANAYCVGGVSPPSPN